MNDEKDAMERHKMKMDALFRRANIELDGARRYERAKRGEVNRDE